MAAGRVMHAHNYGGANGCIPEGTYPSLQQGRERCMHSFRMRLADILDRRRAAGAEPDGMEEKQMAGAYQPKTSIAPSGRRCKYRWFQPGIQGERGLTAKWRPTYVRCSTVRGLLRFPGSDQGIQATVLMDEGGRRMLCRDNL